MEYTLSLLDKKEIARGTMAFYFSKPEGFVFKAGQSMDLTLINPPQTDDKGNTRSFSIAAAPFEEHLMIATRMTGSAFKNVLKEDDGALQIKMKGPFSSSFTLHNDTQKPAIFLTGGIGITPMRSMIREATHEKLPHKIFLFYSNHAPSDAAFLEELQALSDENSAFTFVPTMTQNTDPSWVGRTERISIEMIKEYVADIQKPIYYISGPAQMVVKLKQILYQAGDYVKIDDFPGY